MFDGVNFVASTRVPRSNPQTFGSAGAGPILERCPTNIGLLWSPKMLNPSHRGVTSSHQTWLDSVKLHPTLQVPNLIAPLPAGRVETGAEPAAGCRFGGKLEVGVESERTVQLR
jgi:hypothetical protein